MPGWFVYTGYISSFQVLSLFARIADQNTGESGYLLRRLGPDLSPVGNGHIYVWALPKPPPVAHRGDNQQVPEDSPGLLLVDDIALFYKQGD